MVEYLAIFWQAKVCLEYVGIHAILMEDQHIRMTSPVGRFFGWFVRTVKDDELPDTFFCRMVSDEQFQTDCWSQEFTVAIFADQILWKFGRCRCQSKVTIVNWTYIYDHFLEILRVYLPIYIYMYMLHVPWAGVFFLTRWDGIESHWGLLVSLVWSQGLVIQGLMWPS